MLNLVLFGPPGAGKGTQSNLLIKRYNLVHLSTGDILREEIEIGTALGLEAKSLMDKGDLVPDEVVISMISSKLDNNPSVNGFIFDGFPRTVAQATALDNLLVKKETTIAAMLSLKVTDMELIRRLLERGKNSGRSDDQNEEIIANRIQEYNNKTAPLKEFYASQNKLSEIEGIGSIEDIAHKLNEVIDTL
jgi:adenylate kinase